MAAIPSLIFPETAVERAALVGLPEAVVCMLPRFVILPSYASTRAQGALAAWAAYSSSANDTNAHPAHDGIMTVSMIPSFDAL